MLKIWGRTNSVNVKKVLWAAEELGLEYERIDAGLQYGVNKTPEYLRMNPTGLVPTIDDDGFVLWESHSIVRYLAAKHATGRLSPADPSSAPTPSAGWTGPTRSRRSSSARSSGRWCARLRRSATPARSRRREKSAPTC
jgi:hypothetical protein